MKKKALTHAYAHGRITLSCQKNKYSNLFLVTSYGFGFADFAILCVFDSPSLRRSLIASLRETIPFYNKSINFINQLPTPFSWLAYTSPSGGGKRGRQLFNSTNL